MESVPAGYAEWIAWCDDEQLRQEERRLIAARDGWARYGPVGKGQVRAAVARLELVRKRLLEAGHVGTGT